MIKVSNVTKYFDDFKVLDDFSLHVRKGTIYGLVGPNGAGKTTIINHINGVLKPDSGKITVDGEPVFENCTVKERILNIADDWFFYSTYTIKEMAKFYESCIRPLTVSATKSSDRCLKWTKSARYASFQRA